MRRRAEEQTTSSSSELSRFSWLGDSTSAASTDVMTTNSGSGKRAKAQRQIDTDVSREKASRVVDRALSAINAFHLETPRSLRQFHKRQFHKRQFHKRQLNLE